MVEAFRHWYVRLATTRQPRYGEHLRAHPEQYPDVQPALASAAEEAMD
jgi:hypothetical protein